MQYACAKQKCIHIVDESEGKRSLGGPECRGAGIKKKLHGLSPRANYTDRETAACRRSDGQVLI
jgi:hypothetical protein